jgi:hypothetical protein
MRRYASSAADSRELVDELEFVWDQVKTNVSPGDGGSSGSSPIHNSHVLPITTSPAAAGAAPPPYSSSPPAASGVLPPRRTTPPTSSPAPFSFVPPPTTAAATRLRGINPKRASAPARTVSPADLRALASSPALSTSDGYGAGDDLDLDLDDADEFVDAPDGSEAPAAGLSASRMLFSSDEEGDAGGGAAGVAVAVPRAAARALDPRGARLAGAAASSSAAPAAKGDSAAKPGAEADAADEGAGAAAARADEKLARWRRRVSGALIKLTAEVAALREQLAVSASSRSRLSPARAAWRAAAFLAKVLAVDVVLLLALAAWMRWWGRGGRVEGAFRVLVGDAVAQAVKRVGTGVERSVVRVGRRVLGQGRREGGGS